MSPRPPAIIPPETPAAPEGSRKARLERAAVALGLALPPDATDQLQRFLDLLRRWNLVYNLTAVRGAEGALVQHLFDCLAVLPALQRFAAGRALSLLDVGSGGGLPGAVLAIAQPDWAVTCIDTVAKKVGFVRQVAVELGLKNLKAVHGRVEAMAPEERFDVVVSRAFASLAEFVRATRGRLSEGGVWLAMKGKVPAEEIAALPSDMNVFHVEPLQVPELRAERCLVWMRAV